MRGFLMAQDERAVQSFFPGPSLSVARDGINMIGDGLEMTKHGLEMSGEMADYNLQN